MTILEQQRWQLDKVVKTNLTFFIGQQSVGIR
jgi:hypothetical protein